MENSWCTRWYKTPNKILSYLLSLVLYMRKQNEGSVGRVEQSKPLLIILLCKGSKKKNQTGWKSLNEWKFGPEQNIVDTVTLMRVKRSVVLFLFSTRLIFCIFIKFYSMQMMNWMAFMQNLKRKFWQRMVK